MFRFTIRELVLVTVIVALGVAWWLDRSSMSYNLTASEAQWQTFEKELQKINLLNQIAREEEALRRWKEARERPGWDASKAKSQELGAPQPKPLLIVLALGPPILAGAVIEQVSPK